MYFENRLENYCANLLAAEKEVTSKVSSEDAKKIKDRFDQVLSSVSQYCTETGKLMENGAKLFDSDDAKKQGKREWQNIFMDKYLGMIPLISTWSGNNCLVPLLQEIKVISDKEFKMIEWITSLNMPEYIYRSYKYRMDYNEMTRQLTTSWERLCSEMASHGNTLHGIAISILDSFEELHKQLERTGSDILESVKYRGVNCDQDDWLGKVRDTTDKVNQIHDDLEKYELMALDIYYRQLKVMEMYDYVLDGAAVLINDYNLKIAERDYEYYKYRSSVDEKDCRDFINDIYNKGNTELGLFRDIFKKFVDDFRGKFVNGFDDKSRSELFHLADRADDWADIYDFINDERLMETIAQMASRGDQILEECSKISANKPVMDDTFKEQFKSEMRYLCNETQSINQILYNRIKYHLYGIFCDDTLTKQLIFVWV